MGFVEVLLLIVVLAILGAGGVLMMGCKLISKIVKGFVKIVKRA